MDIMARENHRARITESLKLINEKQECIYNDSVAREASRDAVNDALNHGRSVTVLQGEDIIRLHPDGSTTFLKKLKKRPMINEDRVYYLLS
jgi:hypothetical protein